MIRATSNARSVFASLLDYTSDFERYPESLNELKKQGYLDAEGLLFVERSDRNIRRPWIYLGSGESFEGSGKPILISPFLYKGNKSVVLRNDGSVKSNRGWDLAKVLGGRDLKLAGERLYVPTSGGGGHKWGLKLLIGVLVIGAIVFLLLRKKKRARLYLIATMFVFVTTLIGMEMLERSQFSEKRLVTEAVTSARVLLVDQFHSIGLTQEKLDTFEPVTVFDNGHEQTGWIRFPMPENPEVEPVPVLLSPMPVGETWIVGFSDGSVQAMKSNTLGSVLSKRIRVEMNDLKE